MRTPWNRPQSARKGPSSDERYVAMREAGIGDKHAGISDYALAKARRMIAAEFRLAGQEGSAKQYEAEPGFTTAPLRALARYIDERE